MAGLVSATLAVACGSSADHGSDFDVTGPLTPDAGAAPDASSPTFGDPSNRDDDSVVACATDTQRASPLPLDVHLMLDTSGSMSWTTASGQTKWIQVRDALVQFASDPRSAGLRLAVSYFPIAKVGIPDACTSSAQCKGYGPCALKVCWGSPVLPACDVESDCPAGSTCKPLGVCTVSGDSCVDACAPGAGTCAPVSVSYCDHRDSCDAADYATPAVPLAALPGGASAVLESLTTRVPEGSTPTAPALAGVLNAAHASALEHPDNAVVTVLATDGVPTVCATQDIPGIAAIAAQGVKGSPSVRTFAIGVFTPDEAAAGAEALDAIAAAGGTEKSFIMTTSQSVADKFVASLNAIRLAAVSCEMKLPVPATGTTDFTKVNVRYVPGAGAKRTIAYVTTAAACDAGAGGWYYDADPATGASPTKIGLCPASCTQLKGDPAGQLDIVLGCTTVVK